MRKQLAKLTGWKAWVAAIVGAILVIAVASIVLLAGTVALVSHNFCSDEVIAEHASPDGEYVATSMERNCGATTPYVYHVNLRKASRKFSRDWAGTITDGEVFTASRHHGVRADWISATELLLITGECGTQQTEWNGIRIRCWDGSK